MRRGRGLPRGVERPATAAKPLEGQGGNITIAVGTDGIIMVLGDQCSVLFGVVMPA
jgi:hypothetical protein